MATCEVPHVCPHCGKTLPPVTFTIQARDNATKVFEALRDYHKRNGPLGGN